MKVSEYIKMFESFIQIHGDIDMVRSTSSFTAVKHFQKPKLCFLKGDFFVDNPKEGEKVCRT